MEYVRLKYANNKLINANIKEHREVIDEYVEKKGHEYVGFIPVVFGPSGKILEVDLIFKKPGAKSASRSDRDQDRSRGDDDGGAKGGGK